MRRGTWHQCGDRSQKMVIEQLKKGVGVGVIISPRDVPQHKAIGYSNINVAPMYSSTCNFAILASRIKD